MYFNIFYDFILSVFLSVCMSLFVSLWAMLPDSNKTMMMMIVFVCRPIAINLANYQLSAGSIHIC